MQQRDIHKFRAKPLKLTMQKRSSLLPTDPNRDIFPLTFEQQRLWFLEQFLERCALHNIANRVKCQGKLKLAIFEQSLKLVVERQASLRTSIHMVAEQPVQRVHAVIDIDLPVIDLRGLSSHVQQQEIASLEYDEWHLPFILSRPGLWRVKLIWIAEERYQLCVTIHHIISDGWSMNIFYQDLLLIYAELQKERYEPLPPLALQYGAYALWQRSRAENGQWEAHQTYWRNQLDGRLSSNSLPRDYPRPTKRVFQGEHYPFAFSASTVEALNVFCQQHSITFFVCLTAVFAIILSQSSKENDVLFGTTIAQRSLPEVRSILGLFTNTLVLRIQSTPALTFLELLTQVREVVLEAYEHQDLPFDWIVDVCKPVRRVNCNPLFQVAFVLLDLPLCRERIAGVDIEVQETFTQTTKFDLIMYCTHQDMTLAGVVEYATDLYRQETIAIFIHHYLDLLTFFMQSAEMPLAMAPSIVDRQDWQQLRQALAPRNATEQRVINVYQHQLRQGNISIMESFSSLGGRQEELPLLRDALQAEFEMTSRLSADNIAQASIEEIALHILREQTQHMDQAVLDRLLAQVESLSEEEITSLLENQNR